MTRRAPRQTQDLLVETSALVAILLEEPDWQAIATRIEGSQCCMTAVNAFEATLALARQRGHAPTKAHEIVVDLADRLSIDIVSLTPPMVALATAAREKFGAGRNGLNMGDCLSYAAAKHLNAQLLFKGNDFAATDINDDAV